MRGNDSPMNNHLGTAKPMVHCYRLEIRYRRKMPPHPPENGGVRRHFCVRCREGADYFWPLNVG